MVSFWLPSYCLMLNLSALNRGTCNERIRHRTHVRTLPWNGANTISCIETTSRAGQLLKRLAGVCFRTERRSAASQWPADLQIRSMVWWITLFSGFTSSSTMLVLCLVEGRATWVIIMSPLRGCLFRGCYCKFWYHLCWLSRTTQFFRMNWKNRVASYWGQFHQRRYHSFIKSIFVPGSTDNSRSWFWNKLNSVFCPYGRYAGIGVEISLRQFSSSSPFRKDDFHIISVSPPAYDI